MQSLAELAGARAPSGIDEISVVPRLLGRPQEESGRFLYWENLPRGRGRTPPWTPAVRRGDWKVIRLKPKLPLELYSLDSDPGEKSNVADEHPEVVRKIEEYLKTARTPSRTYPPQEPSWGYDRLDTG